MPGRNDWGEVTSTSNTTDYQARNLNIKFRDGDETKYVHMLNGTLFAASRAPIAILENNQQEDGSVVIPEVLHPYMGKDKTEKDSFSIIVTQAFTPTTPFHLVSKLILRK